MNMRRFRYWMYYLSMYRTKLIIAPFFRRAMKRYAGESVDGIKIVDMSLRRNVDHRFQVDTVAALQLIKSVDPRRYRRIQGEIEFVVNGEGIRTASYNRPVRMCDIDYGRYDLTENPEWYLWWYATILVHEATHGAIFSRYIAYIPRLRVRIERLCHLEQKRFAKKADTNERAWSEALVGQFDEEKWHKSWQSTFIQRLVRYIGRLREARRSLKK